MKKIILTIAAVFAFGFANAQEGGFQVGFNAGIPMGDAKDGYSLAYGFDVAYLMPFGDKFKAGGTIGYASFMGKEIEILGQNFDLEDISFVPIAATAQYSFTDNIFGGLDLGYAVGVAPSGIDGGLLFQPKVGYQTEKIEVYTGYRSISVEDGSISSFNVGLNYKF